MDMENFRHNYVNLTGFRLVNYGDLRVVDILQQIETYQGQTGTKLLNTTGIIKVGPPSTRPTQISIHYTKQLIMVHSSFGNHRISK